MRQLRKVGARCAVVLGLVGMVVWLTGCQSDSHVYADLPGSGGAAITTGGSQTSYTPGKAEVFHVTDGVRVTLAWPDKAPTTHDEHIKDDGTITPPEIGPVRAAGRTTGDLQKELQEKYDRIYRNMTVTVTAGDRYYYILGEVNQPGPKPVLGETDFLNAISSAGGFTDFGDKKKVRVYRPNGQVEVVNYNQVLQDPGYNVRIYPNDKIVVKRKWF